MIAASFLDNFNNIVASLKDNPNMDQYGASGDDTETAGEVFAAGDVVVSKIDNVNLLTAPEAGAEALGAVTSGDALVYLGAEKNGYLQVQSSGGQGWINKLLVRKQ